MTATLIKGRPDLRVQKSETELAVRRWIESKGGALISINWKKRKVAYLDHTGNKRYIDVSPTIPK